MTKSHVPVLNAPARISVPVKGTLNSATNESVARQKRGRPIGSKDSAPRKRRVNDKSFPNTAPEEEVHSALDEVMYQKPTFPEISAEDNALDKALVPEETMTQVPDNRKISIFHIFFRRNVGAKEISHR